jgi:hypothetical protein
VKSACTVHHASTFTNNSPRRLRMLTSLRQYHSRHTCKSAFMQQHVHVLVQSSQHIPLPATLRHLTHRPHLTTLQALLASHNELSTASTTYGSYAASSTPHRTSLPLNPSPQCAEATTSPAPSAATSSSANAIPQPKTQIPMALSPPDPTNPPKQ